MSTRDGWLPRALVTVGLIAAAGAPGIEAMAAASSAGAAPAGCAAIHQGATGGAVKTIQKAIGVHPDGDFGPHTEAALVGWQKQHNVPANGYVDASTWNALPSKVAVKACSRQLSGAGFARTCAVLDSGVDALAVVVLQRALGVTADGQFGPVTDQALRSAQRNAGLPATGVTDAKTWKALHRKGTPVCTRGGASAKRSKDARAQAKVRARVQSLAASLAQRPGTTGNKVALQAMHFAQSQIGKPYRYGAVGPKSYDCSGLQMAAYLHAGLTLPRVAAAQYVSGGQHVPLDQARQGDLLFYANDVTKPQTVYHVVMFVGHDTVLDAPYTGRNVETRSLWTTDLMPMAVRPTGPLTLPLRPGTTGWSVSQLQMALNRHHAGIPVDGGFGPTTKSAVQSWQARIHRRPSGVVHVGTWLTLG